MKSLRSVSSPLSDDDDDSEPEVSAVGICVFVEPVLGGAKFGGGLVALPVFRVWVAVAESVLRLAKFCLETGLVLEKVSVFLVGDKTTWKSSLRSI